MSDENLALAVIIGSVRQGRFGPVAGRWFAEQARQHGQFTVDVIDLADIPLPLELPSEPPATNKLRPAAMASASAMLARADAMVLVTPEYNHSFPASLKCFIDWHFTEWRAKPIGLVSYGGLGGGQRAVEHLRLVFAELHAITVRDTVSFVNYWEQFDSNGRLSAPEVSNGAVKVLLDQLAWWAKVLHDARRNSPYDPGD